jgi:alkanesulfonate monooxygenase SsuD/methylene tetrahydromethanopterin reductase-like flavin-dependent oxidoreductase (luciferase family)
MTDFRFGIMLASQSTAGWPDMLAAAQRVDRAGYDHLWTWDHLHAIIGDPLGPIYEGYAVLGGWAAATDRVKLGLLVGAIPFRNPGVVAKAVTTIDHISGGRAIAGLGAAWFDYEHTAHGLDFGASVGERLRWLDEATGALRTLFDGGSVTSPADGHYAFRDLRQVPPPVQGHLPIMIGGGGEQKTLRIVARYADYWNVAATVEDLVRKREILVEHCAEVGRDPAEIIATTGCWAVVRDSEAEAREVFDGQLTGWGQDPARWHARNAHRTFLGPPELLAERFLEHVGAGYEASIVELASPFDAETIERVMGEVKPLVDRG